MLPEHFRVAGILSSPLESAFHGFSEQSQVHTLTQADKPVDARPTRLDYTLSLSDGFSRVELASLFLSANVESGQNLPSEWRLTRPAQCYGGISWCAIHSEWANQKPPTISSFDTQADSIYTFRKYQLLGLVSRIFHRKAYRRAGHGLDNPGTSAIPLFRNHHT